MRLCFVNNRLLVAGLEELYFKGRCSFVDSLNSLRESLFYRKFSALNFHAYKCVYSFNSGPSFKFIVSYHVLSIEHVLLPIKCYFNVLYLLCSNIFFSKPKCILYIQYGFMISQPK